jgi:hypothetical protein
MDQLARVAVGKARPLAGGGTRRHLRGHRRRGGTGGRRP